MSRDNRFRLIFLVATVIFMAINLVQLQANKALHLYHNVLFQVAWVELGGILLLLIPALIVRSWFRSGVAPLRPQILAGQFILLAFLILGLVLAIHNLG